MGVAVGKHRKNRAEKTAKTNANDPVVVAVGKAEGSASKEEEDASARKRKAKSDAKDAKGEIEGTDRKVDRRSIVSEPVDAPAGKHRKNREEKKANSDANDPKGMRSSAKVGLRASTDGGR